MEIFWLQDSSAYTFPVESFLLNCVFIYEVIMNMFYIFWSKQLKSTAKGGSLPAHSSIKPKEDSSEPGDSKVSFL